MKNTYFILQKEQVVHIVLKIPGFSKLSRTKKINAINFSLKKFFPLNESTVIDFFQIKEEVVVLCANCDVISLLRQNYKYLISEFRISQFHLHDLFENERNIKKSILSKCSVYKSQRNFDAIYKSISLICFLPLGILTALNVSFLNQKKVLHEEYSRIQREISVLKSRKNSAAVSSEQKYSFLYVIQQLYEFDENVQILDCSVNGSEYRIKVQCSSAINLISQIENGAKFGANIETSEINRNQDGSEIFTFSFKL